MKRTVMMIAVTLVVGIAVGILTTQALLAQQAPVTRTTLQQKDIEGAPGKEVIMYVADLVPGGVAGRHSHPGPEVAYILEGSTSVVSAACPSPPPAPRAGFSTRAVKNSAAAVVGR